MRKRLSPEALREKRIARFWSHVDVRGPSDCWNWKHRVNRSGYGEIRFWGADDRGQYRSAHRFSYELVHGLLPKTPYGGYHGIVIAHRCDNRRCVNPAHLFATTQKGNLDDCLTKGRGNKAFGEDAGRARLSEQDVEQIRARAFNGEERGSIADDFGITKQSVVDICSGKTWRHLPHLPMAVAPTTPDHSNARPNSGSFKPGSKGNPGPKPEKRTIDYAEAKRLHASGLGIREIARRMNTTHTTVRRAVGA